ncbi:MAG: hypothetical protein V4550_18430 [Gemmatimonadota bacterium]
MNRDYYAVLGESVIQEMSTPIGAFDYGGLVKGLANVAATGIEQKQAADAADKSKKDSESAVQKSIGADQEWANAEANLELATIDPTATAASRVMRDSKKAVAIVAGASLQGDGIGKRCKAAQDALVAAASDASKSPKDIAKQAKFKGWKVVTDACGAPPTAEVTAAVEKAEHGGKHGSGSWITSVHGGLPVWGWGLVGVGSLTAITLIMRSMRKK